MQPRSASFVRKSEKVLEFIDNWQKALPVVSIKSLLKDFPADETAIVCIDMVNGFCKHGNLASERVGALINPIVELFRKAEQNGINYYLLPQDSHSMHSKEFAIYPEHCTEGSEESRTVQELADLPQAYKYRVFPKNTINPGLEKNVQEWLNENENVRQFIVVGDCTDICIHQMAMFLKLRSIHRNEIASVVVPANCVDTFDIPLLPDRTTKAMPHPGDLMNLIFLYHMHLNGIRIVAEIE